MKIRRFLFAVLCSLVVSLALPVAAAAPTTGKFVFTFDVTVSSTVPKDGVVVCTANASVTESSSGQVITQKAIGIATPSSGKATCTATMPYSWALSTASSDKVFLSYSVEVDYAYQITASNGTGTLVTGATSDKVNQNLAEIAVPKDGATTDETVTATI
jgi:hypothetical protein